MPNRGLRTRMALDEHFRGDWIHHQYPDDPLQFGDIGGRFWPQVASHEVIHELRAGVAFAIHKAMGDTELANIGLPPEYRERLWKAEVENEIDVDDGIRGIALSWNCVANAGRELLRGRRAPRSDGSGVRDRDAAPVRAQHGDGHGRRPAHRSPLVGTKRQQRGLVAQPAATARR